MRRSSLCNAFLAAVLLSLAVIPAAFAATAVPDDALFVPGEVVISLRSRPGISTVTQAKALAGAVGARVLEVSGATRSAVVSAGPGADVPRLIQRLSADPRVRFAEPNYIYRVPRNEAIAAKGTSPTDYIIRKVQGLDKPVFTPKAAMRAMRTRAVVKWKMRLLTLII